jgi:hypothetical protein
VDFIFGNATALFEDCEIHSKGQAMLLRNRRGCVSPGATSHDEKLWRVAILMYRLRGQLIHPYGAQGEQVQETNYVQSRQEVTDLFGLRGEYNERWMVFWITAHFLNGAAQLAEMGCQYGSEHDAKRVSGRIRSGAGLVRRGQREWRP